MRVEERAHAKVNLVLHVGAPRPDGLHPLCSLFASLDLADVLTVEAGGSEDMVICPGVEGENLAARALEAFRAAAPGGDLPPLRVTIGKRIPIAAGLGGGSADAAAVLRAANRLAGAPLDAGALRSLGASLGSDVPSQIDPRHALVTGTGELVEPLELTQMGLVLLPRREGLSTAAVYAELDRLRAGGELHPRGALDPEPLRRLASGSVAEIAAGLENDLEAAALSLRPELEGHLAELRQAGALAARISGSGPTAFGVFGDRDSAGSAARSIPRAILATA